MPVTNQTTTNTYTGNGVTTVFAYTFRALAEADISVMVDGVTKTLSTDYSLSGIGTANGGNVTFVTAPASDAEVVITRDMDVIRDTDYQDNGDLLAETLDDDMDRAIMLIQQLRQIMRRALRAPIAETSVDELPSAADRASKYLAFDADGKPVATSGTASEVIISVFAETLLDDASAADARATLGAQASDAELDAIAGLVSAANKVPMFSGSGTATMLDFKDEDNMASDSATAVPSQQSVKAYADTKTTAAAAAAAAWAPKAWLRMTCAGGTPSIVSSYNVASITDNGSGDFTVNFTIPFANANYCGIPYTDFVINTDNGVHNCDVVSISAGAFRFKTMNGAGSPEDNHEYTCWVWFGDQ